MKKLILICLLLSLPLLSYTQPNWVWAKSFGSTSTDQAYSACTDNAGNIYMIGWFSSTITLGPNTFTNSGDIDIFIMKLNPAGTVKWSKKIGTSGKEKGVCICVDNLGYLYASGSFSNTITLGPSTLTSAGATDIFFTKMDTAGNYIWAKRAGSSTSSIYEENVDIELDHNNNIIIAGQYSGTAYFDSYNVTSLGGADIFVAKYDNNGNALWVKSAGSSTADESAHGISLSSTGDIYVSGYLGGTTTFSGVTVSTHGAKDAFIAKYDSTGTIQWAKSLGGSSDDESTELAVDNQNNIYAVGSFYGNAAFDTLSLNSYSGSKDVFLVKFNPTGSALWVQKFGGSGEDICLDVITLNNTVLIAGMFSVTGYFGSNQLTSAGGVDAFVAKFGSTGNNLWAVRGGSTAHDAGFDVCVDPNNNIYVSGYSRGNATFGSYSFGNAGDADIFIAKLHDQPCSGMPQASFTGLNANYLTSDAPATLIGTPVGGVFYGVGVIGNTFSPNITGPGIFSVAYVYDNAQGCTSASCQIVEVIQAVMTPEYPGIHPEVKVYPNPGTGIFNLIIKCGVGQIIETQVFNNLGQLVFSQTEKSPSEEYNSTLDLNTFTDGVYILNIKVAETNSTQKLTLMR